MTEGKVEDDNGYVDDDWIIIQTGGCYEGNDDNDGYDDGNDVGGTGKKYYDRDDGN